MADLHSAHVLVGFLGFADAAAGARQTRRSQPDASLNVPGDQISRKEALLRFLKGCTQNDKPSWSHQGDEKKKDKDKLEEINEPQEAENEEGRVMRIGIRQESQQYVDEEEGIGG